MKEPQRIVCIHMNQLGDLLFSLPAIYNLRAKFPQSSITSILRPNLRELLEMSSLVDNIIERPIGSIWSDIRLGRYLRQENYDLLLLFSTSISTWMMAQFSGASCKAGFVHSLGGLLLDIRVPWTYPPSIKNNLELIDAIGCPVSKRDYTGLLQASAICNDRADKLLESLGINPDTGFIVLAPGASNRREIKCWTDERFAEVADQLWSELKLKSVIVGLAGGENISRLSSNVLDLTGKTSLPMLVSILDKANLFIGIDSGIMHFAAAMETPVVALFGPSDPKATGPQGEGHIVISAGLDCSPCFKSQCKEPLCMIRIQVAHVTEAAAGIIKNSQRSRPIK